MLGSARLPSRTKEQVPGMAIEGRKFLLVHQWHLLSGQTAGKLE
jgi:hypothetical protein